MYFSRNTCQLKTQSILINLSRCLADVSPENRQSFIRCNHFSGFIRATERKTIECVNNRAIGGHKVTTTLQI